MSPLRLADNIAIDSQITYQSRERERERERERIRSIAEHRYCIAIEQFKSNAAHREQKAIVCAPGISIFLLFII